VGISAEVAETLAHGRVGKASTAAALSRLMVSGGVLLSTHRPFHVEM
jgi:hypothetical protein